MEKKTKSGLIVFLLLILVTIAVLLINTLSSRKVLSARISDSNLTSAPVTNNKNFDKVSNIIESLTINPNPDSVGVLEEIGTNSSIDEVREMTSRALVKRNETNSLNVVISNRGKGINDMSTVVAMSTINELLSLENKEEAMKVLENTINSESFDDEVKENARSVKALMALS